MNHSIEELMKYYGDGNNYPSKSQWKTLLAGDLNRPLTVVNFFRLRQQADFTIIQTPMTGEQAFDEYAKTSVPKVAAVGGHFVLRGAIAGDFIGEDAKNWHIVAIGQYPRRENFIRLLEDQEYREAFRYRQAAVENQTVFFVDAM
ncbi:DUF1330 domain-containing protein [Exilibacterium tricleocarpae]|uniref:DUF1330 domain-containing protein n=1 Tax=Exilibacterium tricleocarpae TaxID=2591008 RepID=A0A545ST47_9GAMM|nr:DUF1330 domain-containing protein [Exilibacterium tricleocarpae]TQV68137.1 DUF1330 domain-containing protein [Exilibacterium tricleocarpae]